MPFSNVAPTNSLEYFRVVTNQLVTALNYFYANNFSTTGPITINPAFTNNVSLNVANGIISGNGYLLFSVPAAGLAGTFARDKLQNTTFQLNTANGVFTGGTVSLGSTVTINLSVVDSTSNTRTNLPLAVNAIITLITEMNQLGANASYRTTGLFAQARGGLAITSYSNGQILLSNGVSSGLEKNTITQNAGIEIVNQNGSISVGANLIQGANILFTRTAGKGIIISVNTYPTANLTTKGITTLNDTVSCTSTTQAATANSLNAMARLAGTIQLFSVSAGRLIRVDRYNVDTQNTVWNRPTEANIDYIVVEVQGAGASEGQYQANAIALASAFSVRQTVASGGGGGGGYLKARITSPNSTYNVVVGRGGTGYANTDASALDGANGGNSSFGDNLLIAIGGFGGANSRAYKGNSSLGVYGNVVIGPMSDGSRRGWGGGTSNVANGTANVIVDIANAGANCGDIYIIMGGRVNAGGKVGNLNSVVIGSKGGNPGGPYGIGGPVRTWASDSGGFGGITANNGFGGGSSGAIGCDDPRNKTTYNAANGLIIVYSYSLA